MSFILKITLCSALFVMVFTADKENDLSGDVGDDNTPPDASEAVIRSSPLSCEECEILFPDGECKLNFRCLMERSFSIPASHDRKPNSAGPSVGEKTNDGEGCQGKCLFLDKSDNCRMDFICLLGRDVEGTLRFLLDMNVDADTAVSLSFSAKSHGGSRGGGPCKEGFAGGDYCLRNGDDDSRSTTSAISDPPVNDCPGRCEVRAPSGKCVMDYDCANNDA